MACSRQKFQQLVTDGITVSDEEVWDEYRRDNEKIKIDYVVIKPDDLAPKIEAIRRRADGVFRKEQGPVCCS